jgi:hypothetical protein
LGHSSFVQIVAQPTSFGRQGCLNCGRFGSAKIVDTVEHSFLKTESLQLSFKKNGKRETLHEKGLRGNARSYITLALPNTSG